MAKTITMDYLKKEGSIQVCSGTIIVEPNNRQRALNVSELAHKYNGRFATYNSTVCYIAENKVFVAPITRATIRCLEKAGFTRGYFYVPFSNGDYPLLERFEWERLIVSTRVTREKEIQEDCTKYCDEHEIGTLKKTTLQNCLKVPHSGIKLRYPGLHPFTCFPIICNCFDFTYIGKFGIENGIVAFVYRDGNTYVTKGYHILTELSEAGYTMANLFVPFSNGETILDPYYQQVWQSIKKK